MVYHSPQQYRTIRELDLRDAVCPCCLQHREGFHLMTRTWEKHYHHPTNTRQKCKFVQKINLIHVKRGMSRFTLSHNPSKPPSPQPLQPQQQQHTHTHTQTLQAISKFSSVPRFICRNKIPCSGEIFGYPTTKNIKFA